MALMTSFGIWIAAGAAEGVAAGDGEESAAANVPVLAHPMRAATETDAIRVIKRVRR
jgi:hypothetical protein